MPPEAAEIVTGVPAAQIVEATRTLWSSRPVAF
jgi:anaerobic selenocysteine-containing dehydrogenase